MNPPTAEIISIGTELLLGEIVDANAAFLAGELADLSIPIYWISQVGDNGSRLREALRRALARSNIVLCTGGLGPTDDDLTRETVATVMNEVPAVDPALEATLRERFGSLGRAMPEKNRKQAWLIPSAESLPNPLGTAPGWWVTNADGGCIVCMPGVPAEMRSMWTNRVRPRLEAVAGASFAAVTLKTFGSGESAIEERLGELVKSANPSVATYAKRDGVHVRVAASGKSREEAQSSLQPALERVRAALGADIYGSEHDTLGSVVGALLQQQQATVATAESITGGLVASYLTDVPGSSAHVLGGVVVYNREMKHRLGVPDDVVERHGLVSAETALALAGVARTIFGSDFGIGTTGVAGPNSHDGQDPGIAYVAVTGEAAPSIKEVRRNAPREAVKHFVALSALDLLRRTLS